MSIFKEHKTSADRSATDRSRHKKKIEKAIRDGVHHIVSEESIIGQDGKKKIKIPVRGIKEFRFVYGDNSSNKKAGSAQGKDIKKGMGVGQKNPKSSQGQGGAGDQTGEEYYEVEITLEELASYLFDSLNLPDLEKKSFKNILSEKFKRQGYRKKGIRPRLSKKETLKSKIKRKNSSKRMNEEDGDENRFPFHEDDLRYRFIKSKPKESSNAVIFFMMDVSGSMTQNKKYIARSFFFLLYHFLNHKYDNTEIVFVAHTTRAKEVDEDHFFKTSTSGGTYVSSAVEYTLDTIKTRYHPESWNIYAFHCSDGDNWPEDTPKAIALSKELKLVSQLYCYCEIVPKEDDGKWGNYEQSSMSKEYDHLVDKKFKIILLTGPDDIWPAFSRLFGGTQDV